MVEDVLSIPPLGGSRDSYLVEHLYLHFLAVVLSNLRQLLCQPNLNFLHPTVIGCLLQGLYSFLGHLSSFLGSLQLGLQLQDLLFLCGQLYLGIIEHFALILSLVLGIFQTGLSTFLRPLLRGQFSGEPLDLLLGTSQGLVGLDTEAGLNLSLVPSILDLLLGHKNLLDSLHINSRRSTFKKKKKKRKEKENTLSVACQGTYQG